MLFKKMRIIYFYAFIFLYWTVMIVGPLNLI